MDIVCQLLGWYYWVIIARVLLSWLPIPSSEPFASIVKVIHAVTDPIMEPLRKVIPSMGGLDFSPIVVIIGLGFVTRGICN